MFLHHCGIHKALFRGAAPRDLTMAPYVPIPGRCDSMARHGVAELGCCWPCHQGQAGKGVELSLGCRPKKMHNGGRTILGLSRGGTSTRGTLEYQGQAAGGGEAQHLSSSPSPDPIRGLPRTLTGGRLSHPAAWSLPRSSPAVSGSHRGTASLSSAGEGDVSSQQERNRFPSTPHRVLPGYPNLCPRTWRWQRLCTTAQPLPFLGDQRPVGSSAGTTPCPALTLSIMPFSMMGTPDL